METPEARNDPTVRGGTLAAAAPLPRPSFLSLAIRNPLGTLFNLSRSLDLTLFHPWNSLISRLCTTFHVNNKFYQQASRLCIRSRQSLSDARCHLSLIDPDQSQTLNPQGQPTFDRF